MKVRAMDRQSVLDLALQSCGSMESALALAVENGLSLTERLAEGQELTVREPAENGDARTAALYRAHGIEPATEASPEDMAACPYGGIGFMGIEVDFEVS